MCIRDSLREAAGGTARETDQPLGMLPKERIVRPRFRVVALQEGLARESQEVPISRVVPSEEGEVPALFAVPVLLVEAVFDLGGLEPDDRVHSPGRSVAVEL